MKRCFAIILLFAMVMGMLVLTACNDKNKKDLIQPKTGMFFKTKGFADVVYSISESNMTPAELTTIMSL